MLLLLISTYIHRDLIEGWLKGSSEKRSEEAADEEPEREKEAEGQSTWSSGPGLTPGSASRGGGHSISPDVYAPRWPNPFIQVQVRTGVVSSLLSESLL